MLKDWTVVISTAEDCGHCIKLEESGELKNIIDSLKQYNVIHINVKSRMNPTELNVNADYRHKYQGGWFPSVSLFPTTEWESGTIKTGYTFNGILSNGKIKLVPGKDQQHYTKDSIRDWINGVLNNPPGPQERSKSLPVGYICSGKVIAPARGRLNRRY